MLPTVTISQSEEIPHVFFIAESGYLSESITQFFQNKSLAVVQSSCRDIDENVISDAMYKAVWLVDVPSLTIETIKKVQKQVHGLRMPLIIIVPIVTAIKSNDSYVLWSQYSLKQKAVIDELSAVFTTGHFIFIENLLLPETRNPLFSFFHRSDDKTTIYDPDMTVSLLDERTVLQAIEEPLFRPGFHQSLLVKGSQVSTELIVGRLQQQLEHLLATTVSKKIKKATEINTISFTVQEKMSEAHVAELIQEQIRLEAIVVQQLPEQLSSDSEEILPKPRLNVVSQDEAVTEVMQFKTPVTYQKTIEVTPTTATTTETTTSTQVLVEPFQALEPEVNKISQQFESEHDVQHELQRIFTTTRTEKKVKRVVKIAEVEDKIVKKSKHKKILFWGGLGVMGAGMSLLTIFLAFSLSFLTVKQQLVTAVRAAETQEQPNWETLATATKFLEWQASHYSALVDNAVFAQASQVVDISNTIQKLKSNGESSRQLSTELFQVVMQQKPTQNVENLVSQLEKLSQEDHESASSVQENLQYADLGLSESERETSLQSYTKIIQDKLKIASATQQLVPLLPQLLGLSGEKNYALVFQNNQELRPTGGFIQTVAVITVSQGTITNKEFFSSYDLDEKVSGFVAPPEEISQLLGEERLFLRDSNWNPDFPKTAEQISWFVENTTNKKVDGVFAIDVYGLEKLLTATGPVELPQYNEVITDKNVNERLEFHSEVTFVNKEDNPDYSTVLFSALFEAAQKLPADKIPSLYAQMRTMLKENNMLISLSDSNENMSIKTLGWSGSMISPECPAALHNDTCFVDFLAQVEANVGVNKANYYIDRSINHTVTLDSKEIVHKRTITYKNKAQTNTWPKGNYKAYTRLYVPKEAALRSVYFNTTQIPQESIKITEENNRKVIGFLIDVPINSQSIVEIEYAQSTEAALPYSYAYFEQKQPGSPATPFTLTVIPPQGSQPVLIAPAAQVFSNTIVFQETQNTHLFYGVSLK